MRFSTVLLKPRMSKVIFYNPWLLKIFHFSAYLYTLQRSNFHQWKMGHVLFNVFAQLFKFWGYERISFQHPVRIVVIDGTIQFKSCFIRKNYIEKKVGVIVSFFIISLQNFIQRSKLSPPSYIKAAVHLTLRMLQSIRLINQKIEFYKLTNQKMLRSICSAK